MRDFQPASAPLRRLGASVRACHLLRRRHDVASEQGAGKIRLPIQRCPREQRMFTLPSAVSDLQLERHSAVALRPVEQHGVRLDQRRRTAASDQRFVEGLMPIGPLVAELAGALQIAPRGLEQRVEGSNDPPLPIHISTFNRFAECHAAYGRAKFGNVAHLDIASWRDGETALAPADDQPLRDETRQGFTQPADAQPVPRPQQVESQFVAGLERSSDDVAPQPLENYVRECLAGSRRRCLRVVHRRSRRRDRPPCLLV